MQFNVARISPYTIDVPGRENLPGRDVRPTATIRVHRKRGIIRISDFCFIVAGAAALTGMCMGIAMGIAQDFTLAPAHAHLNLLGWVTMALYGLYHRGTGRTRGALGWTQVGTGALGAALMSGGLALYLSSGDDAMMSVIVAGSLLAFSGMVLFVATVLVDLRHAATGQGPQASAS